VLSARGHGEQLKRAFDRSPVPMLMIDGRRRYVEVNRPARLLFRLSLAQMRRYTVEDLTPPEALPMMEAAWARLLSTGCVAGQYEFAGPDGSRLDIVYYAVANALPSLHLGVFAPADWPDDELGLRENQNPGDPLTPRELEVLQLAAEGLSGPSIAERLFVSPGTVKTHFGNLYEKLSVSDRAAAVAKGMRLGLID
jgi:DNA-binding CsgD family transcriptional regulator